jgi:hypothetical protein
MNLHDLQENKFAKLRRALSEVFNTDFNFEAAPQKLVKVQEATARRITLLNNSGVDASNKDYQKLLLIKEGLTMVIKEIAPAKAKKRKITESADLDQAEVLLAAKQLADDLQKMAENLASMQVEDLMSITNAMKEEVGTAEAEAFNAAAEAAIGGALEAVKAANASVSNAVLVAQGQPVTTDMDTDVGMEPESPAGDMGSDEVAGGDLDIEAGLGDDEFAGADGADSGFDDSGREMKEDAYLAAMRMVKEAQANGTVNKAVLKAAFAKLRN